MILDVGYRGGLPRNPGLILLGLQKRGAKVGHGFGETTSKRHKPELCGAKPPKTHEKGPPPLGAKAALSEKANAYD
jgi:hypothetical protein